MERDKSPRNFLRQQVLSRCDKIDEELLKLKALTLDLDIKLNLIIDFLTRKEENREYFLGSYKTDFNNK